MPSNLQEHVLLAKSSNGEWPAPSSNLQTPGKHQTLITKRKARLGFGDCRSLVLGGWGLEIKPRLLRDTRGAWRPSHIAQATCYLKLAAPMSSKIRLISTDFDGTLVC